MKKAFVILLVIFCMGTQCDENTNCSEVCLHLAECENEWYLQKNSTEMTDTQFDQYVSACQADCSGARVKYLDCVILATCDELGDGECR